MRHALVISLLAAAVTLALVPAARADDNATLSDFLASCQSDRQKCVEDLTYGYEAAYEDMGEVCPPQNLAESDAAETELRWLQNAAASNSALAAGKELDAEWTALHTLWPCAN